MAQKHLDVIAAVLPNMGIGWNGNLPWHSKSLVKEMKFFTRLTSAAAEGKQNAVIMGRKTWESIPDKYKPLRNRINVVLSRTLSHPPPGAHYQATGLSNALEQLSEPDICCRIDLVWIIGGSSIYKEALMHPACHRIFITRILHDFEADTFFPHIDLHRFSLCQSYPGVPEEIQEENEVQYKYEVYERVAE
uniref:dihydrofolate reductase-like n=1 Tax=Myxine glutinosa TaxID=7769 RepID=UPI00358E4AEF